MVPVNVFLVPVLVDCFSEKFLGNAGFRFFGHDQYMLAFLQNRIAVRYDYRAVIGIVFIVPVEFPYPGHDKPDGHVLHDVFYRFSVYRRIADAEF